MLHGADIYTHSISNNIDENDITDFSSNINPLGIPDTVIAAAINSIKYTNRYPDIHSRKLITAISTYEQVPESWIFVSNGAAEAIYRIALSLMPHNGLVTAPTFSEYEQALNLVKANIKHFTLHEENNFIITEEIINYLDEQQIAFICNPNNPTGQIASKELIKKIISYCKKNNTIVVVDECFMDFVENNEAYSVVGMLNEYKNLIVLKAFTKSFAIPGIRVGYCICSDVEIIKKLKLSGPPWNISTIAQEAGIASTKEKSYLISTRKYIKEQRNYLVAELNKLNIKVFDSYANYILFKFDDTKLKGKMLEKNILIRSCSNYKGLNEKFYRIAVKTKNENQLLIKTLKEIIGK